MTTPRFAGEPVTLGGTEFIVPPVGLFAMKTLLPRLRAVQIAADGSVIGALEHLDVLYDLALAALQRNYPELTLAELQRVVEVPDFAPLIKAAMRQGGLTAVAAGNAPAVASPSIGRPSTADSLPPSAGPGSTSTST